MTVMNMIGADISKVTEGLRGFDDIVMAPRTWSPDDLKEACNNTDIRINCDEIDPLEKATLFFLVKQFFFLQHQTGLYNVQKKLWSSIARANKAKIEKLRNPQWIGSDKYKISDIYLDDTSSAKYIKARLVHPNSKEENPGFRRLITLIPKSCTGLFYISGKDFHEKFLREIAKKTNSEDKVDKYRSPITSNCSLILIKYTVLKEDKEYEYKLVHPNLDREVKAKVCL